ncbi:hypothetical protein VNO78_05591 [Psophocarpus tetragonolobus]|uniref:Uncharacterized protein n=1 Tax=Psophocarpus tetragonolobus TaxID=3891 RepID=A0AAN9SRB2_PSOTE
MLLICAISGCFICTLKAFFPIPLVLLESVIPSILKKKETHHSWEIRCIQTIRIHFKRQSNSNITNLNILINRQMAKYCLVTIKQLVSLT